MVELGERGKNGLPEASAESESLGLMNWRAEGMIANEIPPRKQSMKILLVSSGSGSRGGGEIFLKYLASALSARGHSVITWMPTHSRMNELASQCATFSQVVRVDLRNTYDYRSRSLATMFNLRTSNSIARDWAELRPDVIHINKQNLEDGLDLLRAARISGRPSVSTIHLTQTARYLRARGALLRDFVAWWELQKFKGTFVAVQDIRRNELSSFLGSEARTRTIFNGVPLVELGHRHALRSSTRAELGIDDSQFLVVGLGRLVPQKRPFVFLDVARKLYVHHPHTRFVWVGDGELSTQWSAAIARAGLAEAVSCIGWKSDARPYLAAADLLLHTAEYEGLPFALIEAMSAGVPCAISRPVVSELPFLNRRNAICYDTPGLLEQFISRRQALKDVGEAGHAMVSEQFSDHAMAAAYEKLYAEQVARSR
jgi:glycosyltransferase involved in cell wall biosynthesis